MAKRLNGDGAFDSLPSGQIRLRVYINGKRVPFTGRTQAECRKKYQAFMQNIDHEALDTKTTLQKWLEKYLESYRKGSMKQTSYHQLELLIKRIDDDLLSRPVCAIKPIDLQSFLTRFSQDASKSYASKMSALLRSAFDEAHDNDLCVKNPARKLKAPQVIEAVKESYTRDEVATIIDYAKSYRRNYNSDERNRADILISTAVVALLMTGMRRGELLGLTYGDIDRQAGVIHVRRAVFMDHGIPTVVDGKAKTYSSIRDIPTDLLVFELIDEIPQRGLYPFSAYSGRLMNPRNFSRAYESFMDNLHEAHPEVRKLSPHCCRHTYATLIQKSGEDIRSAQLILGHTSIKTTARYSHPDMEQLRAAGNAYSDFLFHDPKRDQP